MNAERFAQEIISERPGSKLGSVKVDPTEVINAPISCFCGT